MPQAQAPHDNGNQSQHNERQVETPEARGFGRLAVMLFILFLCVLLLGFSLLYFGANEPTKATQFWAPNILNALLLAVVVIQAIIYAQQWDAMRESTQLARHALYISERPYVEISKAEVTNLPFEAGKLIDYEVVVENKGHTPAYNLEFLTFIDVEAYRLPENPTYRSVRTTLSKVTLTGTPMKSRQTDRNDILTQEQVDAIAEGKLFVYIWGVAKYGEGFTDKTHRTRFYLIYNPEEERFIRGGHHNDAD